MSNNTNASQATSSNTDGVYVGELVKVENTFVDQEFNTTQAMKALGAVTGVASEA